MDPKSVGLIQKNVQNIQWVIGLLVCLIFVLGFTSCVTQRMEPNQTSTLIISPSLTTTGTISPSATNTPPSSPPELPSPTQTSPPGTPTKTPVPQYILTPLVQPSGPQSKLRFDSWSPDGQWFAYWTGEGYGESDDVLPASLAFFEVISGESCLHEEVIGQNLWDGRVHWQEDGRAIVVPNPGGDTLSGIPCENFAPSEPLQQSTGEFSPDGHYRADHVTEAAEGGFVHIDTTITDLTTSRVITSLSWDFAPASARREGPGWVNNDLYVIGPAVGRGVLYVSVPDGAVGNVLTALLDLEPTEDIWSIFTHPNPATGDYHLLLQWEGGPTRLPLLLYHSEFDRLEDQVEELPFYKARPFDLTGEGFFGFSPDGQWLLLGEPAPQGGAGYWLRRIHPAKSEAVRFGQAMGNFQGVSPLGQLAAFYNERFLQIVSFPDGDLLSKWETPGYQLNGVMWSPDGKRLIAYGLPLESDPDGLFVIEP